MGIPLFIDTILLGNLVSFVYEINIYSFWLIKKEYIAIKVTFVYG